MYEYKLTALPTRGRPQKGSRGLHEAFGVAIEEKMNKMIHDGWDFVEFRDVPIIERRGFAGQCRADSNHDAVQAPQIPTSHGSTYAPIASASRSN